MDLTKLSGSTTDEAPSIVESKSGIIIMLQEYLCAKILDTKEFMQFHCIIHQEALCSKLLGFENVMKVVVPTVNCIKS